MRFGWVRFDFTGWAATRHLFLLSALTVLSWQRPGIQGEHPPGRSEEGWSFRCNSRLASTPSSGPHLAAGGVCFQDRLVQASEDTEDVPLGINLRQDPGHIFDL